MKYLAILIIMVAGSVKLHAQKLASEKPVNSFYSKTTKQNLDNRHKVSHPAATQSRQELASAKALPQPSVPPKIQPVRTSAEARLGIRPKLASEKPIDMKRIYRQRAQVTRASSE